MQYLMLGGGLIHQAEAEKVGLAQTNKCSKAMWSTELGIHWVTGDDCFQRVNLVRNCD